MGQEPSTTRTRGRTDAQTMIAELWAEREEALSARSSSSPAPGTRQRNPERREPRAGGKERALATAIVLLLVGAGAGVGAKAAGLIGAPSKATFLAEADAICTPGNAGVSALSTPTGYASVATAASTLVATTDAQLNQLRTLRLPGGEERGPARAVLAAIGASGDAGRTLQAGAAASNPTMTAQASRTLTTSSQDAVGKAKAFGFTACATGMQPAVDAVVAGANGAVKLSFLEKGNALCRDLVKAGEAVPQPRNANDLPRYVNATAVLFEKLATDLMALPAPPGDEATVAGMTVQLSNFAGKLRELGAVAVAGDRKRVTALDKEGNAILDKVNEDFGAYGLTVCGSTD